MTAAIQIAIYRHPTTKWHKQFSKFQDGSWKWLFSSHPVFYLTWFSVAIFSNLRLMPWVKQEINFINFWYVSEWAFPSECFLLDFNECDSIWCKVWRSYATEKIVGSIPTVAEENSQLILPKDWLQLKYPKLPAKSTVSSAEIAA